MKLFFQKKTLILIAVFVIIAGYFIYAGGSKDLPYEFVVVKKTNLTQEVSATGRVKALKSVNLSFEKGGSISNIYSKVGQKVSAWQVLAVLNNQDLRSQVLQAEARLEGEIAKLDDLKIGTRPEEIKIQEVKVFNAKKSLTDTKRNVVNKINEAYTKSDDAIRNKTSQLFSNPSSPNPTLNIPASQQSKTNIEWNRFVVEGILKKWNSSLTALNIKSDLSNSINEAKNNLNQIRSFLSDVALVVNGLETDSSISQATINIYRADINTARTNIDSATTNLLTIESNLQAKESNLDLVNQELFLKKAGSTKEQIATGEALVKVAKANLLKAQADLAKTIIRAPFSGIITKKEIEVGEVVPAGALAISLISEGQFEIEVNIPEVDISKINIGNNAKVTLDAYGDDQVFQAKVVRLDPAETIIDGVAIYKTIFHFDKKDDRVLPGMTANLDILTRYLENVVTIPSRAIVSKNGIKMVKILNKDNKPKELEVKTGIYDAQGNVEITGGLNIGDKVIIFTK